MESKTLVQTTNEPTISDKQTLSAENATLIQPSNEVDLESGTAIMSAPNENISSEIVGTKLISKQSTTDKKFVRKSFDN